MTDVKIFVSCHKPSFVPDCKFLVPVQAGASLSRTRFSDMYHDDEGINISGQNKTLCELTVQYWAWKNIEADYYGFFHYRRYLSFKKTYPVAGNGKIAANYPKPYREVADIKENLDEFRIKEERIAELVKNYEVISIIRERSNSTAGEQYCQFHFKKDLELMIQILKELHPDFTEDAEFYLNSRELYFMNIYIMRRDYFYDYMEWLFPILEEYGKRTDNSSYSEAEQRTAAYLAERLFGIYFTRLKREQRGNFCELPYVVFGDTDPREEMKPVFAKPAVPIVLSANRTFVPCLAVMIRSLIDCSTEENNYDIIVLHCDIEPDLQIIIKQMTGGKKNVSIRFCDCTDKVKGIPFRVHHHFSIETFYRYFILDLLKGYDKILYLDSDMAVCRDVADLYREDVEQYDLAAVRDMDVIGACKSDERQKQYLEQTLGLKKPLEYFQAGVMVMNLRRIGERISSQEMVSLTLEREWRMVDQDVLNILCEGRVKFLPQKWNVLMDWKSGGKSRMDRMKHVPYPLLCEYREARQDPAIIHYAGGWKPWNTPCCDFGERFWEYARRTPFYETLLCDHAKELAFRNIIRESQGRRVFRLKSTHYEIAVNMKWLNRLLPAGTRRRMIVRAIFKGWL